MSVGEVSTRWRDALVLSCSLRGTERVAERLCVKERLGVFDFVIDRVNDGDTLVARGREGVRVPLADKLVAREREGVGAPLADTLVAREREGVEVPLADTLNA